MTDIRSTDESPPANRGGWPRLLIVFGGVAAILLIVAGFLIGTRFGGSAQDTSGEPNAAGSPGGLSKAAAYSACMRENGITNYPNPDARGGIRIGAKDGIDIQSAEFKAAEKACVEFRPKAADVRPPPANGPASFDATKYVSCMRQNGIPDFPDSVDGMFAYDPSTEGFAETHAKCEKLLPTDAPDPAK